MSRPRRRQLSHGAAEHLPDPALTASGHQPPGTPMLTVLVIDADAAARLAVKNILEPAGLSVIAVADAAAALERLAVIKADLVICDIDTSAPDGTPAVSAFVELDPAVSILALMPKQRDTAVPLPRNANALEKPFTASQLLREVWRALVGSPPFWSELY
jgi:CheY-like chemotaxis protein